MMSDKSLNDFLREAQKMDASFKKDFSKPVIRNKELKRLMNILKEKKKQMK